MYFRPASAIVCAGQGRAGILRGRVDLAEGDLLSFEIGDQFDRPRALAAICNAAIVPIVNVLCVLVFARFGSARLDGRGILKQLAANPLVISCLAGIAF